MVSSVVAAKPSRVARHLRRGFAGALVLATVSCEAPTAPLSIPRGHYELARVSGAPITEARICGILTVLESSLILGPGNAATFTERITDGGRVQSFLGTGAFREVEGKLRVSVKGLVTYSPAVSEPHQHGMRYEFDIVDAELHRYDGGACDARESLEYLLHAPF